MLSSILAIIFDFYDIFNNWTGFCLRPSDPLNGFIVSNPLSKQQFAVGESVIYICNAGYCLAGSPTVACESFGWTHIPPCLRRLHQLLIESFLDFIFLWPDLWLSPLLSRKLIWLIYPSLSNTHEKATGVYLLDESAPAVELTLFPSFASDVLLLPCKFAACSKLPSKKIFSKFRISKAVTNGKNNSILLLCFYSNFRWLSS